LTKAPKTHNGEKTASTTNVAGKLDMCLQKTETRYRSFTLYKYELKWIKDLNIRPETLKLVHERAGNTLETIRIGNDFLSRTQTAQKLRQRINK
jgi:hypothetical protein